jgi:hypothetical protein
MIRQAVRSLALFSLLCLAASAATLNLQTLPANQFGGHYVGPAGSNLGPVVCIDYNITTNIPNSFDVNIVELNSPVDLQLGYLYTKMMNMLPEDVGDLQFAIWEIKNPSFSQFTAKSLAYVAEAQNANLTAGMFSNLRLYLASNTVNQGFIGFGGSQIPEPGTWAMFGAGFVLMGLIRRRARS